MACTLSSSDPATIAGLIGGIVERIDVAADAVTITLNNDQIAIRL